MKCETKYCNRKQGKYSKNCNTCKTRKWRLENPMKSAYQNLKHNAKRRGKVFEITFEDFEKFCIKTNYIAGKGVQKNSFHIDRKEETKGYEYSNLQVLTNTQNVKKYITWQLDQRGKPEHFRIDKFNPIVTNVPF